MIRSYSDHAANERTFLAWVRTAIAVQGALAARLPRGVADYDEAAGQGLDVVRVAPDLFAPPDIGVVALRVGERPPLAWISTASCTPTAHGLLIDRFGLRRLRFRTRRRAPRDPGE